jgi:hemolysin activation/secretion protein
VRGGASYSGQFRQAWLWTARGQAQYSPDLLISGEQFGLGGLGSVRGTEIERPLSGDSGISGTFEVHTPELAAGLRLLGFVDGGYIANNEPNTGLKPSSDRIASVGAGLRYGIGQFAVSADYGRLVVGSRVSRAANPSAPRRGDDRVYLNLSVRF